MSLEVIIGLEIHAQLNTATKLFCGCDNDAFNKEPNTLVCPICMGLPGVLPVANKAAIEKVVRIGKAFHSTINTHSKFDRKNYFYPDLPYGYQISQYDEPVCSGGYVDYMLDKDTIKRVSMTRVHLENDAGKLTHSGPDSLADYNRAGSPLAEIVTNPDIRSALEAREFAKMIQRILRYVNASDADMEKGMMRFDASISMRPIGDTKLYPRAEIKNLNSFTSLYKALKYEIKKQTELWNDGKIPNKETTVGWNEEKECTYLMREKESAADYRYFPDPDLPPLELTNSFIDDACSDIHTLPVDTYNRYRSLQLTHDEALTLIDNDVLRAWYEDVIAINTTPTYAKKASNILLSVLKSYDNAFNSKLTVQHITDVLALLDTNKISSTGMKTALEVAMDTGDSIADIVIHKGLEQSDNTNELTVWIQNVLNNNPKSVDDYKMGKQNALQFLTGQVMKESKGRANPSKIQEILMQMML